MVRVVESVRLGIHCGVECATFTIILAYFYLWISLAFTLTTRLYLNAYYHSAHMAGLGFFIALFVISHHTFGIRRLLGCSYKAFYVFQCIMNTWHMLLSATCGVCYSVLLARGVTINFDFLGALIWGFCNMFFMLYLLVLTSTATRGGWYSRYNLRGSDKDWVYYHHDGPPGTGTSSEQPQLGGFSSIEKKKPVKPKHTCRRCCRVTWNIVFGFFYTLFQLIFMVVIFLTAYHPATVLGDVFRYRDNADLYTVQVEGHQPLALYLKCRGNGNQTIIYENGLGGLADMQLDFIPKFLGGDKYKVCVHDRRGYGWSEGWEYDNINTDPQWAKTNSKFFKALVEKAQLSTPFFYMGHSYGGYHLTYTALEYPELIDGLIYLDSSHFSSDSRQSVVSSLQTWLQAICNFQPLGLIRIATDLKLIDLNEAFESVSDFKDMDPETNERTWATVRSGYYVPSYHREGMGLRGEWRGLKEPRELLQEELKNRTIDKPVLVVDAGSPPEWFETQLPDTFPRYNSSFSAYIPGASHETLVYTTKCSRLTAQLIENFIQYVNNEKTFEMFQTEQRAISRLSDK